MEKLIQEKLREIEANYGIRIILAVEAGSRAWGSASPDSDYDVRFVYVRPKNDYLRLEESRDVIELPINEELDINGWDLQKALRLMYKSNPSLFEWLSSPKVYRETGEAKELRSLAKSYFCPKKSLYHYVSMASGNYREYLRSDTVKAKKYLYVLRPVLACRWVLDRGTQPPMLFDELAEAELPQELRGEVARLLDIKRNHPELKEIPRVDDVNDYLEKSIVEIKALLPSMKDSHDAGWTVLNEFFMKNLGN